MTNTTSPALCQTTAYAEGVLAGDIVAGPHVFMACRRHLDDLKHGDTRGLSFDTEAANRVFMGEFPVPLAPSQAFVLGSLYGWKVQHRDQGETPRFRRAYLA